MTPYVVNEADRKTSAAPPKPKSIMVNNMNGDVHKGDSKPNGDTVREGSLSSREENGSSYKGSVMNGNGRAGKPSSLKRVSFGSSKGSMVETLVYDHHEAFPDIPLYAASHMVKSEEQIPLKPPSKVRVTFYESQKPNYVTTPESPDIPFDFMSIPATMTSPTDAMRHVSTDLGADNPFRPDGELSREAESIISLIKEGKPITPVPSEHEEEVTSTSDLESPVKRTIVNNVDSPKHGANGIAPKDTTPLEPGLVEVQHGIVVPPSDASQVEQVMIKKKPKCKCCVIQ